MADLASLWSITPNTVSRRLAFLNIKPVRQGNFRFITTSQLALAQSLHMHIKKGQPMANFFQFHKQTSFNSRPSCDQNNIKPRRKPISKKLRWTILERDGHQCRACGAKNCLEIDHIIPQSKGGLTVESNLQVLCADCNKGKGVSVPADVPFSNTTPAPRSRKSTAVSKRTSWKMRAWYVKPETANLLTVYVNRQQEAGSTIDASDVVDQAIVEFLKQRVDSV